MTGFGRGESKFNSNKIVIELKTVNHRFYELSSRMPSQILFLEDKIRSYINTKIKRGKVNFALLIEGGRAKDRLPVINKMLAKKYCRILNGLKKDLGLKEGISLGQLIQLPDIITSGQKDIDPEKIWPAVKSALDVALEKLVYSRQVEGAALRKDLEARVQALEEIAKNIQAQAPVVVANYKKALEKRISQISSSLTLDAGRLETEVAIFAKNCDISEEASRIAAHIKGFKSIIAQGRESGRQLDFIAQELSREINTTGAKAQDISISRWVIQAKEQIEKIREQVQNVE